METAIQRHAEITVISKEKNRKNGSRESWKVIEFRILFVDPSGHGSKEMLMNFKTPWSFKLILSHQECYK